MLVATSDTRQLAPRLRDQLKGALVIETRILLVGVVALAIDVAWWASAWLALRHVHPDSTSILPQRVATIQALSEVLLALTPSITAVASLGPSLAGALQSRTLAFSLTQALTRRRVLALRVVPGIAIGWLLDAIAVLGTSALGPHLAKVHPDWGMLAWHAPAIFALTFALCALAALLALLTGSGPATIGASVLVFLVLGIGATIMAPRLLPPRVAHLPALALTVAGAGPAGQVTAATTPGLPPSDDAISTTYRAGGRSVASLTFANDAMRCAGALGGGTSPQGPSPAEIQRCLRTKGLSQTIRYQPPARFGAIDARATLLLGLVGLLGVAVLDWRTRHLEL